jgi:hypothetical protein
MKKPRFVLLGILAALMAAFFSVPLVFAQNKQESQPSNTAGELQQAFIWSPSSPYGKQAYVVFRKTFSLQESPKSAVLNLFADSRYILWINGKYVNRGPCRFDPIGPDYDVLDVTPFLQSGENVIAILVHHYHDGKPTDCGDSFAGRMMRHVPGLTASLEIADSKGGKQLLRTDNTWRSSAENRFGPSAASWTSIPDNIDARRDSGDWTAASFNDSTWEKAVSIDGKQWGTLRARHIPLLRETEVQPLYLVQKQTDAANVQTFGDKPENAKQELSKVLPIELSPGNQIVIEADRFVQAYSILDMEADAGSQLELFYGESFYSTGNKPEGWQSVGLNHYVAKQGRQTYMSGDTYGHKYMAIRCTSGKVKLLGIKLVNRVYPFDVVGTFSCNDPLVNDIWQLGVRTVQVVSEDAYVDCATRERVEWLGDSVMVSYPLSRATMAGQGSDDKLTYSDPRLFGNTLRHTGQSVQPDGRVKAHHPSNRWDIHGYIEDYSCIWIQGLHTWNQHTGDLTLVQEMWPAVTSQLKWFLDHRSERGLVLAREFTFFGNPLAYKVCEGATLNAFVVLALNDAAEMAKLLGKADQQREYADAAAAIQNAINKNLWDDAAKTYHGSVMNGEKTPPTAHAAAICLFCNVVPAEYRKSVESWLVANIGSNEFQPFQYAYCFEDLARMHSEAADRAALTVIRQRWVGMTQFETKTTWEGFGPGENCHDMGSPPTIYLSRHVLGVDLDGPVSNHKLAIEPHLGDLKHAEGVVVTELGPVPVSWTRSEENGPMSFELEIPAGAAARVFLPKSSSKNTLKVDGREIQPVEDAATGKIVIELPAGKHHGE